MIIITFKLSCIKIIISWPVSLKMLIIRIYQAGYLCSSFTTTTHASIFNVNLLVTNWLPCGKYWLKRRVAKLAAIWKSNFVVDISNWEKGEKTHYAWGLLREQCSGGHANVVERLGWGWQGWGVIGVIYCAPLQPPIVTDSHLSPLDAAPCFMTMTEGVK